MRNAYALREHTDAKRVLDTLLHQLIDLNPSATRSLEEGMEETLTMHLLAGSRKTAPNLAYHQPD
jgi:putative transposase